MLHQVGSTSSPEELLFIRSFFCVLIDERRHEVPEENGGGVGGVEATDQYQNISTFHVIGNHLSTSNSELHSSSSELTSSAKVNNEESRKAEVDSFLVDEGRDKTAYVIQSTGSTGTTPSVASFSTPNELLEDHKPLSNYEEPQSSDSYSDRKDKYFEIFEVSMCTYI